MNKISWMLYLADIVTNVKEMLQNSAGALGAICFILFIWWLIVLLQEDYSVKLAAKLLKYVKFLVVLVLLLIISGLFIPSKQTVLAIAASETTETVVRSQEGKEMLNKLKDKILEKIK